MTIVPRTCTELHDEKETASSRPASSKPLAVFRDRAAYVLLGDPGMGKSTAFQVEADHLGRQGLFVSARDLATFDADKHPEWRGKTLFIDGLDEIRAGGPDPRTPLDSIRRNLDKLAKPPFRLSCRHADWLVTDQKRLATSSPAQNVTVLSLDPLSEQQATALLQADSNVDNARVFLKEAKNRGMEGLLYNPQSLSLLARAVHDGEWPAGRKETFHKACLAMAGEYNEEHLSVGPPQDPNRILDSAGRLCAVLLVSGASGYTTGTRDAANYPYMTVCGRSHEDCRQAVSSNLFRHGEEGRAEPVHRQIAEYVAARHIVALIHEGLPVLRVLALISGPDGGVVSELRGLSAWLAALSWPDRDGLRHHLIERDPVGVALYGDIQAFSANEHRDLFDSLVREPRKLEPTYRTAPAFASLATQATKHVLEQNIRKPPDGPDGELVADFVLRLLCEAPPLPDLSETFLAAVRDNSRWPRVKSAALTALVRYNKQADNSGDLLALLRDIRERRIADPTNDLLGQLLIFLYPRHISPDVVWDYVKEPAKRHVGAYQHFWVSYLPGVSSDAAIAELLDRCSSRLYEMERAGSPTLESCIAHLLVRGLKTHGDDLDTTRLYNWLDAGVRLHVGENVSRVDATTIRDWIEARPHRHLDLLLAGIRRLPDDHWHAPYDAFQRLFGALVTSEFFWECAASAKSIYGNHRRRAESLLRFAAQSGDLDPQRLQSLVADNPSLTGFLQRVLNPPRPSPEVDRFEQQQIDELQRQKQRELEALRSNENALRNNTAPPALLHHLAQTYFDIFINFTPSSGVQRLQQLLTPHKSLLDAAQIGLRLTLERHDVPDADEILKQCLESRMHYLCWPYLAGLAEAERTGTLEGTWWTGSHIRQALAIYFGYAHGNYEPSWYRHLIAEHPEAVAEVQVQFAVALFRKGIDTGNTNLQHLAVDRSHAKVARHASLPLLRAFPARAKSSLLRILESLLFAALQHADRGEYEKLVARKLSGKSLPPRQRGRWLAAGCTIATEKFAPSARAYLCDGRRQARTLYFASFFCSQGPKVSPVKQAGAELAHLLVHFVGRIVAPDELRTGFQTPAMEASLLVSLCIRILASDPDQRAADALADLLGQPDLSRWRDALARATDDQRVCQRDHAYRHLTAAQAAETLQGGPPASPADLAALVLDRLSALAVQMRSGSTDDWKEFWNESGHGRPTDPKPEESCTQALVRGLRRIFPEYIKVNREVRYPNDARPDISVSCRDYRVPIEVKRNDNRHLWRAARTQLMAKYTIDPATDGHGIYVVLWFGRRRTQLSPSGTRPDVPADLQEQLEATITDDERRTVHFRVIDVAVPPNSAT